MSSRRLLIPLRLLRISNGILCILFNTKNFSAIFKHSHFRSISVPFPLSLSRFRKVGLVGKREEVGGKAGEREVAKEEEGV